MWMGGLRPLGPEETTENLNAINQLRGNAPWQLSISYGRALKKDTVAGFDDRNCIFGGKIFYSTIA